MGGGGGGGGAGGKGSKKGKGKKGAGKKKGKKGAKGGKKNGKKGQKGKCGKKGGGASCSGCSKKASAGEPIDIASGAVFTSDVDFHLPGLIDLEFLRFYSTDHPPVDRGIGIGWVHPFSWSLTVQGRRVEIVDTSGHLVEFVMPALGEAEWEANWMLVRTRSGFILDSADGFQQDFRPLPGDPRRYVLARVHGPSGSRISFDYDGSGRLRQIRDSAGRELRVDLDARDRIQAISCTEPQSGQSIVFARYDYDAEGHLVQVTDADGAQTRYAYDEHHRLVHYQYPTGLTFHYRYDDLGRCVESWGDYPDGRPDPSLDPDLPPTLADSTTRAKGVLHVKVEYAAGFREVVTASEIQRYECDEDGQILTAVGDGGATTREYDANGNVVAETNRNGATTHFEWDALGQLVSETDPLGHRVRLVRNLYGQVVEMVDAKGGTVRATRNADGLLESLTDQNGATTFYVLDEHGLTREIVHPNGAHSIYEVDAHANCTAAHLPDGEVWRWRHDWWGRLVERTDPTGGTTRYRWSDGGKLLSLERPDGSTRRFHHDGLGNVTAIVEPDGSTEYRHYGGIDWDYRIVTTTGEVVEKRYDREGRFTRFVNEGGASQLWEWSPTGVTRIVHFDGHEERRNYDLLGHLTRVETPNRTVAITRDAMAQPIAFEYGDGSVDEFEYDPLGYGTRGAGPECEVRFERNAVGDVVRETCVLDGEETAVETQYTSYGVRIGVRTSLGHQQQMAPDSRMQVQRIALQHSLHLTFDFDVDGRIVATKLPGGARIESEWDEVRRLRVRRLVTSGAQSPVENEPVWVGKQGRGILERTYAWSGRDNLLSESGPDGLVTYAYDARDRLVEKRGDDAVERFVHDPTSNVRPAERTRVYGAGNRLEVQDGAELVYDDAGFPRERREPSPEGEPRVVQYEWGQRQTLDAVTLADGGRVEFKYDPYQRRVKKSVYVAELGVLRLVKTVRYVWDLSRLVHAITRTFDADGRVSSRDERTYVYHDSYDRAPIAERIRVLRGDEVESDRWCYYLSDMGGTPHELLDGDGRVVCRLERAAYGRTKTEGPVSTATRFPGQFEDEETGLHYNFMRYYDPDAGRYISPDPLGLAADWNEYVYCRNPISEIDPFGLDHGLTWAIGNDPVSTVKSGGSPVDIPGGVQVANPKNPDWTTQSGGCTERKLLTALDDPGNAAVKKRVTDGEPLNMKGEFPPCKKCHRAMKKWAKKNLKPGQGEINYHYPVNQKITYTAGKSPSGRKQAGTPSGFAQQGNVSTSQSQTGSGQNANKLVTDYDNDSQKSDGSFKSTQTYADEKDKATANKNGATLWP